MKLSETHYFFIMIFLEKTFLVSQVDQALMYENSKLFLILAQKLFSCWSLFSVWQRKKLQKVQ